MRYERRKQLLATLGMLSVSMTLMAALVLVQSERLNTSLVLFTSITATAAVLASVAAVWSIMQSRLLARARERRGVFLIYAREDLEMARNLAAQLRERGFSPWLDVDEITPGQVWQKAVIRALEESAVALVLVSEHLAKKGFVQEELKVALEMLQEREKDFSPVVPVRLDLSEVPERLSHVQWVNLFDNTGMERLFSGLDRIVRGRLPTEASKNER